MKYLKLFKQSKYDSEILELIEKYWEVDPSVMFYHIYS